MELSSAMSIAIYIFLYGYIIQIILISVEYLEIFVKMKSSINISFI